MIERKAKTGSSPRAVSLDGCYRDVERSRYRLNPERMSRKRNFGFLHLSHKFTPRRDRCTSTERKVIVAGVCREARVESEGDISVCEMRRVQIKALGDQMGGTMSKQPTGIVPSSSLLSL